MAQFTVNATNWLSLNNVGTLFPVTDNTNQLGSTSNRWTTAYLSTALFMGTNPATSGRCAMSGARRVPTGLVRSRYGPGASAPRLLISASGVLVGELTTNAGQFSFKKIP